MSAKRVERTSILEALNLSKPFDLVESAAKEAIGQVMQIQDRYDYIVCGTGASGCVIARRLSEDPDVSVLVLEAGPGDEVESVQDPGRWTENLGTERDWRFVSEPNRSLCDRAIPLSMGKTLGGGTSINALQWARGHQNDWNFFAEEANDQAWGYDAVRPLYESLEARASVGVTDSSPREKLVPIEAASAPSEQVPILVEAAASIGIPAYPTANDAILEGSGGASALDAITQAGLRRSIYRDYLHPVRHRRNLTILTETLVTRLLFDKKRAIGIAAESRTKQFRFLAEREVIVSLGAINTPKLLMQSGIGPATELERSGIEIVEHLPGVGQNFQDHLLLFGCAWRFDRPGIKPNASRAVLQWKSRPDLAVPDIQIQQSNGGTLKAEMKARGLTPDGWRSLAPALIQPRSRGHIRITGPNPADPVQIFGNHLAEPEDLKVLLRAIALCRELAAAPALSDAIGEELLPGPVPDELATFVRQRVGTFWHQSCTAKMGRDAMSVVDGRLKVYGVAGLRIADASVLPRITAGNTMAPCVIVGELAAAFIMAARTS